MNDNRKTELSQLKLGELAWKWVAESRTDEGELPLLVVRHVEELQAALRNAGVQSYWPPADFALSMPDFSEPCLELQKLARRELLQQLGVDDITPEDLEKIYREWDED